MRKSYVLALSIVSVSVVVGCGAGHDDGDSERNGQNPGLDGDAELRFLSLEEREQLCEEIFAGMNSATILDKECTNAALWFADLQDCETTRAECVAEAKKEKSNCTGRDYDCDFTVAQVRACISAQEKLLAELPITCSSDPDTTDFLPRSAECQQLDFLCPFWEEEPTPPDAQ